MVNQWHITSTIYLHLNEHLYVFTQYNCFDVIINISKSNYQNIFLCYSFATFEFLRYNYVDIERNSSSGSPGQLFVIILSFGNYVVLNIGQYYETNSNVKLLWKTFRISHWEVISESSCSWILKINKEKLLNFNFSKILGKYLWKSSFLVNLKECSF